MKKKKLKQRIAELELELSLSKSSRETWESMFLRMMADLKGYGVKTEIIPAEPPVIDVSRTEDSVAKYEHGISTAPPTFLFDFTEHDKKIICDFKEKCKEDNEPEEIKQCREFLKRENKCYIYITNFFAQPMIYEDLGFSCGVDEIPIVGIKYANGEESEVAITELMKYDTLEKCEKRCEELNGEMKEYRDAWNRDFWRLNYLEMRKRKND